MSKTIGEVLVTITDIELQLVATREMCAYLVAAFVDRDGIPAEQIILTDDGRPVTQQSIIATIDALHARIDTLTASLEGLRNLKVAPEKK